MRENKSDALGEELSVDEAPIKWALNLNDLPRDGIKGEKRANREELQALTTMLKDEHELEVKSFVCAYHVRPGGLTADKDVGDCLVQGCNGQFEIRAELQQLCVVTLERIDTRVVETFEQEFSSRGGHRPTVLANEGESEDLFSKEPPMKLQKGKVELGSLVYQYLSMAIEPNPRKPGAEFDDKQVSDRQTANKPPSPFIVLETIKHKK